MYFFPQGASTPGKRVIPEMQFTMKTVFLAMITVINKHDFYPVFAAPYLWQAGKSGVNSGGYTALKLLVLSKCIDHG